MVSMLSSMDARIVRQTSRIFENAKYAIYTFFISGIPICRNLIVSLESYFPFMIYKFIAINSKFKII